MKKWNIIVISLLFLVTLLSSNDVSSQKIDESFSNSIRLNELILEEVNLLRKKRRMNPMEVNDELSEAAKDHALFLTTSRQLTHFQNRNKKKKTPDDRIIYYGRNFDVVGENVQQVMVSDIADELNSNKKTNDPYHALAQLLVDNWKNSPPHYKNLIDKEYNYTFTAISITKDGKIFACQLFSGNIR